MEEKRIKTGIAVIGGGPAGLAAALEAARGAYEVTVFERNPECGRKLMLTGGGHCNYSRAGTTEELIAGFHGAGRFLYSALSRFGNEVDRAFLAENGVETVEDHRGRWLPRSGRARDILDVYLTVAKRRQIRFFYETKIDALRSGPGPLFTLRGQQNGDPISVEAAAVILATGTRCFIHTGSDGLGLQLAALMGHHLVPLTTALAPIQVEDSPFRRLSGVTLADVALSIRPASAKKPRETQRGELLFSHIGLTGPTALNLSRWVDGSEPCRLILDFCPDLRLNDLETAIFNEAHARPRHQVKRLVQQHVPGSVALVLMERADVAADLTGDHLSRAAARALAQGLKATELIAGPPFPVEKGMTCRGGVSLKEVSPSTMMSKLVPGLFFAGDLLDLDGNSGGYNLQAAFATGSLAGLSARERLETGE